jgi:hypothetical protein
MREKITRWCGRRCIRRNQRSSEFGRISQSAVWVRIYFGPTITPGKRPHRYRLMGDAGVAEPSSIQEFSDLLKISVIVSHATALARCRRRFSGFPLCSARWRSCCERRRSLMSSSLAMALRELSADMSVRPRVPTNIFMKSSASDSFAEGFWLSFVWQDFVEVAQYHPLVERSCEERCLFWHVARCR